MGTATLSRRFVNAQLTKSGATRLPARVAKGILDRIRAMTPDERADQFNLQAMGLSPEQAKALAMTGAGKPTKRTPRFGSSISKMGPTLAEVHMPAAGGPGLTVDRKARRKAKRAYLRQKSAETRHTGQLERAEKSAKERIAKRHMVASLAGQYVQAAYGADQTMAPEGGFEDRPDVARYLDAQRLVAGMDQEISNGSSTPAQARARASGALATDMGAYDRIVSGPDRNIAGVGGLNLDLGSGNARERGFLGLDTYPYDYGTVLHDLGMGIPFPDGSARAVRLVNSLHEMDDYSSNPTALLEEIQRVLAIGGRFYYQGAPLQDGVDWSKLPGMGVVSHQFSSDGKVLDLVMRRVPARNPLVHGADTNFLWQDERVPEDLRIAQAVFGDALPASVCMANLVHKREQVSVRARVLKKDAYQNVVIGAVLIPGVVDSQGDVMDAEDIEQTAHDFMANARVVGREHTDVWEGAQVVESYIAPFDMEFNDPAYGPQHIPQGTWLLAVRLTAASFKDVLDGIVTGFSVGGWGEREDVAA